jgi:hypothetical protein
MPRNVWWLGSQHTYQTVIKISLTIKCEKWKLVILSWYSINKGIKKSTLLHLELKKKKLASSIKWQILSVLQYSIWKNICQFLIIIEKCFAQAKGSFVYIMEWLGQHPHSVQTDAPPKHFLIHIGGEVIVLLWVSKLENPWGNYYYHYYYY